MLKVKTKIGYSNVHGIGLFADDFIPAGTVTWEYEPLFDSSFFEEDIFEMFEPAISFLLHYSYYDNQLKKYVLCCDNQRYINHSSTNFNIQSTPRFDTAIRNIERGEELLCNYFDFDPGYFSRLGVDVTDLVE